MKSLLTFIVSLYLITNCLNIFAQKTDSLTVDTEILVSGNYITFKKGTSIVFDQTGKVIAGTLAKTIRLWTTGPCVIFESDKVLNFNPQGKVISGYIAEQTQLWTGDKNIAFKKGTKVSFNQDGKVFFGTPAIDLSFKLYGNNEINIKEGTKLVLDSSGKIVSCTLSKNCDLPVITSTISLKEGTVVNFSKEGTLISGTIMKRATFKTVSGKKKSFEIGSFVIFDENGLVED